MTDSEKLDGDMRAGYPAAVAEFDRVLDAISEIVRAMPQLVRLMGEAVVCKQHIFVLSKPGLAKSLLAGLVAKALANGPMFALNFNAHTKPSEVFGPVDLAGLKESPSVIRYNTAGKLPEARIAVLDEAFKAGSEILNTLLGILNERTFVNGNAIVRCPLQTAVVISNEYPGEDSLAALWDRILYRYHLTDEMTDMDFMDVMGVATSFWAADLGVGAPQVAAIPPMDPEHMRVLRYAAAQMVHPDSWASSARRMLIECRAAFVMSPRRWGQTCTAVAARAATSGAVQVTAEHLRDVLEHVAWSRHDETPVIRATLGGAAARALTNPLDDLLAAVVRIKGQFDSTSPDEWTALLQQMRVLVDQMRADNDTDDRTKRAQAAYRQAALALTEHLGIGNVGS